MFSSFGKRISHPKEDKKSKKKSKTNLLIISFNTVKEKIYTSIVGFQNVVSAYT